MEKIRRPLIWLVAGVLIGLGFVTAFSGGILLLLVGLGLAIFLGVGRQRRAGWPAGLYGGGVTTAILLLPYVLQPSPCVNGHGSGCYPAFTLTIFAIAIAIAIIGIALAVREVRRQGRG